MSTFQAPRKAGLDFKWKGGRINPSSQVLKINWSRKVLTWQFVDSQSLSKKHKNK